ncbi:MAG: transposase [Natronohydrobacter sp.]|nr:transposase [Natronohydrobacter sp.]
MVIKGAMIGDAFAVCIRDALALKLNPDTVVILDNLATYRDVNAAKAIRAAKCWCLVLAPYAPHLNSIEQAFAKRKAYLCKIGTRTFTDPFKALGVIRGMFTPPEYWTNLHAAGCVSG